MIRLSFRVTVFLAAQVFVLEAVAQGTGSGNTANVVRRAGSSALRHEPSIGTDSVGLAEDVDTSSIDGQTAKTTKAKYYGIDVSRLRAYISTLEDQVASLGATLKDRERYIQDLKDSVKQHAEERRRSLQAYQANVTRYLRTCRLSRDDCRSAAAQSVHNLQVAGAGSSVALSGPSAPPVTAGIASLLVDVSREHASRTGALLSELAGTREEANSCQRELRGLQELHKAMPGEQSNRSQLQGSTAEDHRTGTEPPADRNETHAKQPKLEFLEVGSKTNGELQFARAELKKRGGIIMALRAELNNVTEYLKHAWQALTTEKERAARQAFVLEQTKAELSLTKNNVTVARQNLESEAQAAVELRQRLHDRDGEMRGLRSEVRRDEDELKEEERLMAQLGNAAGEVQDVIGRLHAQVVDVQKEVNTVQLEQ